MRLNRRQLLAGSAALPFALGGLRGMGAALPTAHRLVVVLADGGWDVTFALDPKLGEPEIEGPEVDEDPDDPLDREAVQTVGGIPLVVNEVKRPAVTEFFQRWGARSVVLNGLWVGSIAHDPCRWRLLTGLTGAAGPDLTAIAGRELGVGLPLGSLDTTGSGIAGPLASSVGSVGARGQLEMLLDPQVMPLYPEGTGPGYVPTEEEGELVRSFLARRAERHAERWGEAARAEFTALGEAHERARLLMEGKQSLVDGLVLGVEPSLPLLIDTTISLLADRMCQAVLLDSGYSWDTHENNQSQHNYWNNTFVQLDALVTALDEAALLQDTLVVVLSEMTRTPKRNAELGKDHWPHTSALLLGGPVRGGRTCGGTDGLLESLPMDLATGEVDPAGSLCKYDNLAAGILAMIGVDPERYLPGSVPFLGATVG
jgi:hypothetical protein